MEGLGVLTAPLLPNSFHGTSTLEGYETFVRVMNRTLLEGVRLNLVCWGVQLMSHSVRPHQLTGLGRLMERP